MGTPTLTTDHYKACCHTVVLPEHGRIDSSGGAWMPHELLPVATDCDVTDLGAGVEGVGEVKNDAWTLEGGQRCRMMSYRRYCFL